MPVSTATSFKPAIGLCLALVVSVVCGFPSILPRNDGLGSFTVETKPNPAFKGRNGTAAYLKAMTKYAHLAGSGSNKAADPCKSPSSIDLFDLPDQLIGSHL